MEPCDANTTNTVVLVELDKIVRRLDSIDDKVSAIHAVNERIKKEASFRRKYRDVPLYNNTTTDGLSSHETNLIVDDDDEEDDEEDVQDDEDDGIVLAQPIRRKSKCRYCSCCSIT